MSPFLVFAAIREKLREKHNVEVEEVKEAFYGTAEEDFVEEKREEHLRAKKKIWFIGATFNNRALKVVLEIEADSLTLISAYDPDEDDVRAYETFRQENK